MTTTTISTPSAVTTVRQFREFTLAEHIICDYINNIPTVDAIRYTDTGNALHYTFYTYSDGEYQQSDYCPICFDVDDFNQGIAPIPAHALNEYCQHNGSRAGLIAVDTDDNRQLLITAE